MMPFWPVNETNPPPFRCWYDWCTFFLTAVLVFSVALLIMWR
jgi:hypothetical protein